MKQGMLFGPLKVFYDETLSPNKELSGNHSLSDRQLGF